MKKKLFIALFFLVSISGLSQSITVDKSSFALSTAAIYVDNAEVALVKKSAELLQQDIALVIGKKIPIINAVDKTHKNVIVIGTIQQSSFINELILQRKIDANAIKNQWEASLIQSVNHLKSGVSNVLVIAGNDRRGVAYGVFELSKQIGVSPWYWWADVPVKKQKDVYLKQSIRIVDAPKVKYRGIFINDEAPALSGWTKEKFGGFNHTFYEKVFELLLRSKANYLWPAMWGNAFYADDSLNIKMADKYGIVIGTSHHEPLMRAHDEWRRVGKGAWNYETNKDKLQQFWREGIKRAYNEKIVSIGMRGDGDEPMSRETATALLERIVKDQRNIISEETGKPASETPQLWALYKEVQEYYEKGMSVPDDVTLLLCDDNWGNIRRLPKLADKPRKGGYGIYYHFDYVGGPRNYKWLNTNPLPRIWEQMHLAWEHNVKDIWIVNVGDIKPMEFPISFFLAYAWNPEKMNANDLQKYSITWAEAQFWEKKGQKIAYLMNQYAKYNGRRKPELLDADTYSLNNNEWKKVVTEYNDLLKKAETINKQLPSEYHDAYFQLVLHPIKACANLNEMYYHVALNKRAANNKWNVANTYADKVKQLYANDSLITLAYHQLNNGKWNHMMSQTHIGYTYWQQPVKQKIPVVKYVLADSVAEQKDLGVKTVKKAQIPTGQKGNIFYQDEQKGVSIDANHYSKAINTNGIKWTVLPDHGRTGSAITAFPVVGKEQQPEGNAPHLEYEIYTYSKGDFAIDAYFSPSLNFNGEENGLQYAISVDNEAPQIISLNKEDKTSDKGIWNKWVSENIIIKTTKHNIPNAGKHTLKFWLVTPGVVLQKLVADFGGIEKSYLGPEETLNDNTKK
ncbi:glycosyl hydrolase 115 family protein [Arcicella aquatica]|uniref:Glycosyl hydrolase 115 family protein n=1 Tax=Arcicella aquatica TaxID=217141 RepID=A0ABU5QNV9_9BACT|nr:glycosyl hydrolase 115 family protein [Arcicella aquatica]MEA5258414.1 glycosyl hydrolase 115 family protein [Arcicella aquatica]